MNMTGDPNQRNATPMFGLDGSYPNVPLARAPTTSTDPQCLFGQNNASPFPITTNSGYAFPSTSAMSFNVPSPRYFTFAAQPEVPFQNTHHVPHTSIQNNPFSMNLSWNKSTFNKPNSPNPFASSTSSIKNISGAFGCKRKTDSPPPLPLKQHITEERMAEHMSRLHISSQTPTSTHESEPVRERRLYMCEEMQRLQTESIIPVQLLRAVNRPCTALVPWQPPLVIQLLKENENNNNEEEQDNNLMEAADINVDMES